MVPRNRMRLVCPQNGTLQVPAQKGSMKRSNAQEMKLQQCIPGRAKRRAKSREKTKQNKTKQNKKVKSTQELRQGTGARTDSRAYR